MKNNLKKLLSVGLITATLIGGGQAVHAVTAKDYVAQVPTFSDFESIALTKENKSNAINKCDTISGGKLVSWIEDDNHNNITSKITYSSIGRRGMAYNDPAGSVTKSVHLNISTSIGTLGSVDTTGSWSPDDKNAN